ncbi:MAG: hypothetical protein ACT4QG_07740 [Sporichthyaceae bacterium]
MHGSSQAEGRSRRKPPEKRASFASAVATGAVLAAVVAGGGILLNAAGDGGGSVTQLDTGGGSGSADELVEQIPLAEGAAPGAPESGGFLIPDSLNIPDIEIPDLTGSFVGSGTPLAPSGSAGGARPKTNPAPPSGGGSTPNAATCPTFEAPATVAVNTVYPGGSAGDTVATSSGTLRATRAAFGPCAAKTVEFAVVDGRATGPLGYGAWLLALDDASAVTQWPVVVVTSTNAIAATANAEGICSTKATTVTVTATNKPLVLGLLGTPLISGKVVATPAAKNGPCLPSAAVPIQLDLLGRGTVELAPGTWTFTVAGRSLVEPVTVVAAESGGEQSAVLVVK